MKTFYCVLNLKITPDYIYTPLKNKKLVREQSLTKFTSKYQINSYLGAIKAAGNYYHFYDVLDCSKFCYQEIQNLKNKDLEKTLRTYARIIR